MTEWPKARLEPFRDNQLAKFIRTDLPNIIGEVIGSDSQKYMINGSAGAGNWASVPWIAILDKEITTSTQKGFYPVFLFREDMSGVYLSLNQGTTDLTKQLGRIGTVKQVKSLAAIFRDTIPQLQSWNPIIELRSKTQLGSSYEPSNIGAVFYPTNSIPDNLIVEKQLKEILAIYSIAKQKSNRGVKVISQNKIEIIGIPKPFLLLAGISGTGKTRWVRDRQIDGVKNVEIIPVRPDWHEPSDLLGYISRVSGSPVFVSTPFLGFLVTAWKDAWKTESTLNTSAASLSKMTPHWLCLDEMNLAPVEQYFADYLSIVEQRDWNDGLYSCPPLLRIDEATRETVRQSLHLKADDPLWIAFTEAEGIPLPPNLIVVGTVNMDETTHGFSRKVLDRALTVEFDAVDFSKYGGTVASGIEEAIPWSSLSPYTKSDDLDLRDETRRVVLDFLERWNAILDQTPFRIAYRTINESLLIADSLSHETIEKSLDWIAMTKLLPRLEGDENKLGMDREGNETSYIDELESEWSVRFGNFWEKSRTKRKIDFMRGRLKRSGYTSFWP